MSKPVLSESTILMALLLLCTLIIIGCGSPDNNEVVIYTSVDQMYSEPILNEFQVRTGISVQAVYDVEATKTTGMVNRLIAEKERPLADVFWNGEIIQTMLLKDEGVLTPFQSSSSADIPEYLVDPEGYWVAFGGRARIIIVNTDLLEPHEYPQSIYDLLDPAWPADKIGLAYPMFGTTATHAAALYAYLGEESARKYFAALAENGVSVVDGNSVVRDLVVDGRMLYGLTDTDDACVAILEGKPVAIVTPDQGAQKMGTLVIPNSVGLIKRGPNPEQAQQLIDYLLSEEVEQKLLEIGWSHLPVRDIEVEVSCFTADNIRLMEVDFEAVYRQLETVKAELTDIFIR